MPMLRKVVFAALILAMASAAVMANLCVKQTPTESFERADYVFVGKAVRVEGTEATFTVTDWLKGQPLPGVFVISRDLDRISFFEGSTYIVYALASTEGRLFVEGCSATRVICGQYELRGRPVRTCDNYERPKSYQRIAAITAVSVGLSLGLGLLVGAVKRRFRK